MSDDSIQLKVLITGVVISFVVTAMIPYLAPSYEADDFRDLYNARQEVQTFTGISMVNAAPWVLESIYTPYESGPLDEHLSPSGWVYGEKITVENNPDDSISPQYIGQYAAIKLDPGQKSATPLSQGQPVTGQVQDGIKWYYEAGNNPGEPNYLFQILEWFGADVELYNYKELSQPSWVFTGYRYEFAPLTMISTDGSTVAASDARLSVVWYSEFMDQYGDGSEGLSGGLVLMNSTTNAIVAHITIDEIVSAYNVSSQYSTSYRIDFNGVPIDYNIRFDPEALAAGNATLDELFSSGAWSMAVTAVSAGNLIDISNSTSLSTSLGGILDTYLSIFKLDLPNVPVTWSMVLWVLCILPLEIVILMFLSRFGIVGIGAGIVGNVLLGVL